MADDRRKTEVMVGLFMLMGFSVIAIMVITFGRVGQSFNKYYVIKVEFPNANGLVKDSDVLLSGARIGYVADSPKLVGRSYAVQVQLKIREDIKIPRKSTFLVGSSGLMGDRYVDVIPQPDFDPNDVAENNELIQGARASGLDDLTAKGGVVMDQLIAEIEEIKKMTTAINQGVLHEKNRQNIEETLASLKATGEHFRESSKKLEPILADAQKAVDSAKTMMKTGESAAEELKSAVGDIRKAAGAATATIDSAKGLVDSGKVLIKKAGEGAGPLGTLISDRAAGEDLKVFLSNLRRSGPLFYKDRPAPAPDRAPRR